MHPLNTTDFAHVTSQGPSSINIKAHVSPTLQFGVTAFEGLQTTVLFVDINAAVGLKAGTLSTTQASPFCMEAYLEFYSTFGAQANFLKFFDLLLSSKIFDLTFPLYEVRHASPRSFLFLSC